LNLRETLCDGHAVVFGGRWAEICAVGEDQCFSTALAVDVDELLKATLHQLILVSLVLSFPKAFGKTYLFLMSELLSALWRHKKILVDAS
jgi:hypothetical protein